MVRMSLGICNGPVLPRLSFGGIPRIPRAWPHHTHTGTSLSRLKQTKRRYVSKASLGVWESMQKRHPSSQKKKKKTTSDERQSFCPKRRKREITIMTQNRGRRVAPQQAT